METILAIDIGTTAIKFNLFNKVDNTIITETKRLVPQKEEASVSQTQDPELIFAAFASGIREITTTYLVNELVLSTAMHTLIPLMDGKFQRVYLWSDMRAHEVINHFKQASPDLAQKFYEKTGTPIHEMSPFAKILYFKQQATSFFTSVTHWLGLKEYLMFRLTGELVVDYGIASATGLFNSQTLVWDTEILAYLDLLPTQFAQPVDTNTSLMMLKKSCDELNLAIGTKVWIGASDGVLASYASYLGTGSKLSLTIGTSGAVRYLSAKRQLSKDQGTFCYYLAPNQWVIGGASNNGGRTLAWASELFYQDNHYLFTELTENLALSPIGAKGLVFLPYLNGERAPLWDGKRKGSFVGVTLEHQKADFIRAICEGILYNLKVISNKLEIEQSSTIALSGGFFEVAELGIETANIFNKTCIKSSYNEPSFGAVYLCNQANLAETQQSEVRFEPQEIKQVHYQKSFHLFADVLQTSLN